MIDYWLDAFGNFIYWPLVLVIPILFSYLCNWFRVFKFLGTTICCFLAGVMLGNLYPRSWIPARTVEDVSSLVVCVGIILVLLNSDFTKWIKASFKVIQGYLLS